MKKRFPNSLYPKISYYEIWFRSQNTTVLISKVVLARSGHDIFGPKVSILKSSTQDKRPYKNRLNSRFLRSDLDFFECFWRTCLATFEGWKRFTKNCSCLKYFGASVFRSWKRARFSRLQIRRFSKRAKRESLKHRFQRALCFRVKVIRSLFCKRGVNWLSRELADSRVDFSSKPKIGTFVSSSTWLLKSL